MNNRNLSVPLAFLTGFLYRVLIGLQGIDHIDSGFSNTWFQNIFTHPETMTFYFNYYLTGFLGGLWYQLAPATGMIGFRLLEALVLTVSLLFVYKTFERHIASTPYAISAILLSFLFPNIVTTLHYNTLSFLFLSLSVWLYSRSLRSRPSLWLYLSGMALGVCFFVRIVNLALSILILVPVVDAFLMNQRKTAIKRGVAMLVGMISSCLIILGVMHLIGHLPYFLKGLGEAFGFLGGEETSHASGNLFKVYFKSYVNIILQMLVLLLIAWLYQRADMLSSSSKHVWKSLLVIGAVILIATSLPYLSALALCTMLCAYLFLTDTPREHRLLVCFVMVGAYVFPFGSDIGIPGIYHWIGGILIIPAATVIKRVPPIIRQEILICSLCIASVMLCKTLSRPYGEKSPRWECTARLEDSLLNTYTTPTKVNDYRHVIEAIRRHTTDNALLVLGNQASEIYYATETIPFLGNTQLGTYEGKTLLKRLNSQATKYDKNPVIVFLYKDHFVFDQAKEVQSQLRQWMHSRSYQKVVDDEYLTVYLPLSQ